MAFETFKRQTARSGQARCRYLLKKVLQCPLDCNPFTGLTCTLGCDFRKARHSVRMCVQGHGRWRWKTGWCVQVLSRYTCFICWAVSLLVLLLFAFLLGKRRGRFRDEDCKFGAVSALHLQILSFVSYFRKRLAMSISPLPACTSKYVLAQAERARFSFIVPEPPSILLIDCI